MGDLDSLLPVVPSRQVSHGNPEIELSKNSANTNGPTCLKQPPPHAAGAAWFMAVANSFKSFSMCEEEFSMVNALCQFSSSIYPIL